MTLPTSLRGPPGTAWSVAGANRRAAPNPHECSSALQPRWQCQGRTRLEKLALGSVPGGRPRGNQTNDRRSV